jgi:hypothetical protein
MSVFLRSGRTGMYFVAAGCWVGNRESCTQFSSPKSALDCAAVERLANFEVVVSYDNPRYELVLKPEVPESSRH